MSSVKFRNDIRRHYLAGAALLVLMSAPGLAQEVPAEASEAAVADIVVTGTRVQRENYSAPTPTLSLGAAQIEAAAPANIADYVNILPAFAGSATPRSANGTIAGGLAGANLLNLRNLGFNRTLVLLDGRRVAPSTVIGAVDVNLLPSGLVKQVDVVTGGASAAWGSDAVAGVVNFILDDKYEGVKGVAQGGITDRNDGKNYRFELTGGTSFADGRGHVLVSGMVERIGRVPGADSRSWYNGTKIMTNPAFVAGNGAPRLAVLPGVGLASATDGGLITTTALRGTQFAPDGTTRPFNFGFASGLQSFGGTAEDTGGRIELQGKVRNKSIFGRVSYDVADSVSLFAEASYARSIADVQSVSFNRFGAITIQRDNAFLNSGVAAQMTTLGITSFAMGRTNWDIGPIVGHNDRELTRFAGGASGDFGGMRWNAYFQHGKTDLLIEARNNAIISRYNMAVDAVRNTSGAIVCRSTLTNPGNGCVPFNVFGFGAPSAAAIAYVTGTASQAISIKQDVAAASVSGDPFDSWAGPVSVAAGVEYRRERYDATADALSISSSYFLGNYKPSTGGYNVKEAFAEVVVPLLSDMAFAKQLDLNGAIRVTDYSRSGTVTTYKAGLTYDINDWIRLRGVHSRDIRAPNLNDLFQGGQGATFALADPATGTTYSVNVFNVGNPNLKPEKADTNSFGIVLRPPVLPGFVASVDYYRIKLRDAIVTLDGQVILNRCAAGETALCQFVVRNAGTGLLTQITQPGLNLRGEKVSGIDIDLSYRQRVNLGALDGMLTLGASGSWVDDRSVTTGPATLEYSGALSDATATPDWRWMLSANYEQNGWSGTLRGRYIGSGKISNLYTTNDLSAKDNSVPAVFYVDVSGSYGFEVGGSKMELFFTIDNLLDKAPPATPPTTGVTHINPGANSFVYDLIGRQYRAGIRFAF